MSTQPRTYPDGWAIPVDTLEVGAIAPEAINLNVQGRHLAGLTHGFETYAVRLSGAPGEYTPERVIREWKARFPEFWPPGNRLYVPLTGIQPGEVGVINLTVPGGMKLSTGILVIYADDTSFSFMTPEGHMFAGMITFSAQEDAGVTVLQAEMLIRANDPLYEASFRLGFGHKAEDKFWRVTLVNLARHCGLADPQPTPSRVLVDPRVQWPEWRNLWHNAGIRSALYMPAALLRKAGRAPRN
jgi:hypothetical protein